MLNNHHSLILMIALLFVSAVVTRYLPFLLKAFFERSIVLCKVGYVLPSIIMVILIFHSMENVVWFNYPYGIPELVSLLVSAVMYVWRRNMLLAIVPGMAIYLTMIN